MPMQTVEFTNAGTVLRGRLYTPQRQTLARAGGLPCIVMAHGLGGTVAAGLEPFAVAFADAGLAVLAFDYAGFGDSDGAPRQVVSVPAQLADWAAAIAFARSRKGIDASRIGLWGSSFSGGHVIAAAVADGRVAAVSSQGAMMDGLAALRFLLRNEGLAQVSKVTGYALADAARATLGLERVRLPVVGAPGSLAVLTADGAKSGYLAITPLDWINSISTSWMLGLARYRPNVMAAKLPCPTLFCIAEQDNIVPPAAVEDAARRAGDRAEVRRYAAGHFEIYVPPVFAQVSADQCEFFTRVLAA